MPYVRTRGNQVAIVHGKRSKETRQVEQQELYVFYSRQEALAAVGAPGQDADREFQRCLEQRFPDMRFDWTRLRAGVEAHIGALPDEVLLEHERLGAALHEAMVAFARQLAPLDPQETADATRVLGAQRSNLEVLQAWIRWRLDVLDRGTHVHDFPVNFRWELSRHAHLVPDDLEALAQERYEAHADGEAEARFRFLTEVYPRYAEGWNYLGLIALRAGHLDDAIACFERTSEVGRAALPKRIAKASWWSDLDTRPYMRGRRNLAVALQRAGRHRDAITVATQLARECGDDLEADAHLAAAHLCLREWSEARRAALRLRELFPAESLVAALAAFELGMPRDAATDFLHAMFNHPRTAGSLIEIRFPRPRTSTEIDDHNGGVELRASLATYLAKLPRAARSFFADLWDKAHLDLLELGELQDALERTQDVEARRALHCQVAEIRSTVYARGLGLKFVDGAAGLEPGRP
ncbi:MAG: Tetratricopeptide 2 repeat protein [Cyanobacteria bacterium RYN_339]|nr:Tetratricopeptide 2 repeat protein [Cyanobacteria bacterium RYN_339]